jgi:hypothetical protein
LGENAGAVEDTCFKGGKNPFIELFIGRPLEGKDDDVFIADVGYKLLIGNGSDSKKGRFMGGVKSIIYQGIKNSNFIRYTIANKNNFIFLSRGSIG